MVIFDLVSKNPYYSISITQILHHTFYLNFTVEMMKVFFCSAHGCPQFNLILVPLTDFHKSMVFLRIFCSYYNYEKSTKAYHDIIPANTCNRKPILIKMQRKRSLCPIAFIGSWLFTWNKLYFAANIKAIKTGSQTCFNKEHAILSIYGKATSVVHMDGSRS